MIVARYAKTLAAILSAGALFFASAADACTGIRLTAADGTVVHARTLEFAIDLQSDVLVSPRGFERVGMTPDGQDGLKWKAKYASVGANGVGLPILIDGVNEAGLAAGLFYFPTAAGYPSYTPADAAKTIAPWQLGSWLLDNFASVDEVKANIGSILVAETVLKQWGFSPPVNAVVRDATGKSLVIEYVGGKLNLYDDALGVITNSPAFDWHMTNLRNYVNFSLDNHPPIQLGSVKLEPSGLRHAGHAWRLHAALALRARGGVQPVRPPAENRGRGCAHGLSYPQQLRHPERLGARGGEGRSRQHPRRLHALDGRERSQGEALLLPHL